MYYVLKHFKEWKIVFKFKKQVLASHEDNDDKDGDVEMDDSETTNEQFSYFSPFCFVLLRN